MKRFLLATISLTALAASSASAADLPSVKAAPAAPAPMWTGFYAGLNGGYNWGTNSGTQNSLTQIGSWGVNDPYGVYSGAVPGENRIISSPIVALLSNANNQGGVQSGFTGGAQIGYNYQVGEKVVIGFETDIQGNSIRGNSSSNNFFTGASSGIYGTATANASQTGYGLTTVNAGVDYLGTARARVGYLWNKELLIYGTGGLAYGGAWANATNNSVANINITGSGFEYNNPASFVSQAYAGTTSANSLLVGYSVGGGAEWMFAPNWSLKAEALYWNLGNMNISNSSLASNSYGSYTNVIYNPSYQGVAGAGVIGGNTSVNYQGIAARAGVNYHFNPLNEYTLVSSSLKSGSNTTLDRHKDFTPLWTGFYAGLNGGYNWGTNSGTQNSLTQIGSWGVNDPYGVYSGFVPGENRIISSPIVALLSNANNQGGVQSGFTGGAQIGYNYQVGEKVVIGFETDIQGNSIRGNSSSNNFFTGASSGIYGTATANASQTGYGLTTVNAGVDYLGTARARVGYLWNKELLIYGTGGLAYGGAWANATNNSVANINITGSGLWFNNPASFVSQAYAGTTSANSLLVGYSVGGGAEWMFAPNWSLKAEALYWNLGNMNISNSSLASNSYGSYTTVAIFPSYQGVAGAGVIGGNTSVNYQGIAARAGVNYHFNFASAPVVAKF